MEGINEVPLHLDLATRRLLTQMRGVIIELRASLAPLAPPQNLHATAQAFANKIQWTRIAGADGFEVLWNTKPSIAGANILDVGNSAEWTDNIGAQAITRFYWVRCYRRASGTRSAEAGPASATTLASATGIVPPVPPPPSNILVVDSRTGQTVPYLLVSGAGQRRILS